MEERLTTFEFVQREGAPAEIAWTSAASNAELLEALLETVAGARTATTPAAPLDPPDPAKGLTVVEQVNWRVIRHPSKDPALQVRHPGYGWLTFRLSPGAQRYLLEELQGQ